MNLATPSGSILFVHPRHRYFGRDNQLPIGVIALANSLGGNARGVFARELRDDHFRQAKILLMDVHWFFALESAMQIAARAKRVNPQIEIIVGGYSATIFAAELLARSPIDFVVRGDNEKPLPLLVDALLRDADPAGIPNVAGKNFKEPLSYQLTREDYDAGDYLTIDWFPALDRLARAMHRIPYPTWVYPFIPVFKGCKFPCDYCLGNPRAQRILCGRGIVSRSPIRVVEDLRRVEAAPHLRRAYIIADFIHVLEKDYAEPILSQRFKLDLYYEFYRIPRPEDVRRLAASFRRLFLGYFFIRNHGNVAAEKSEVESLLQAAATAREVDAELAVNVHLRGLRDAPEMNRLLVQVHRRHPWINLIDSSLWDFPMPPAEHVLEPRPETYDRFRALSAKERWKWRVREWLVAKFFAGPRRHRLLFRLNSRFVAARLKWRAAPAAAERYPNK